MSQNSSFLGEQRVHKPKTRKQHHQNWHLDAFWNHNLTNLNSALEIRSIMTGEVMEASWNKSEAQQPLPSRSEQTQHRDTRCSRRPRPPPARTAPPGGSSARWLPSQGFGENTPSSSRESGRRPRGPGQGGKPWCSPQHPWGEPDPGAAAARGKQPLTLPAQPGAQPGAQPEPLCNLDWQISTRDTPLQVALDFPSLKYLYSSQSRVWFHPVPHQLTSGSIVPRSFILLPLRFRCVRFGHFSANTSSPPEILLSLSSSWKARKHLEFLVQTRITKQFRQLNYVFRQMTILHSI